MAQRREHPALQTSGQTWQIRLPDGTVKEMVAAPAVRSSACCFCGQELGDDAAGRVLLSVSWETGEGEQTRSWSAHRACLEERLHEPFSLA